MGLEARLSDDELVTVFSDVLDAVVHRENTRAHIPQGGVEVLYNFLSNYFKEGGTVVTASDLKEKFDKIATPVLTDYMFHKYNHSIDRVNQSFRYLAIPAAALAIGVGSRLFGYEDVGNVALGAGILTGLGWVSAWLVNDIRIRSARRIASADVSNYISNLPVERFEHLLSRAAVPYRELLVNAGS